MEESRFEIMQQVIASIKKEQFDKSFNIENDLIVFDNGSKYPGAIELLTNSFKNVYAADQNLGYWSALSWILDNANKIKNKEYKYVYIIESDHLHFALEKVEICENALEKFNHLGSIRTQEYSVAEQHLYNKSLQRSDGRRYAWVSHVNAATNEKVVLEKLTDDIYESNFLTCLHSVNRLDCIKDTFNALKSLNKFSELDFQKMYHAKYPKIGQLDGGIFHARLGFTIENPKSLSGSWSTNVSQFGYHTTRQDVIRHYSCVNLIT